VEQEMKFLESQKKNSNLGLVNFSEDDKDFGSWNLHG
jgi:hypothetical protein